MLEHKLVAVIGARHVIISSDLTEGGWFPPFDWWQTASRAERSEAGSVCPQPSPRLHDLQPGSTASLPPSPPAPDRDPSGGHPGPRL